MLWGHTTLATKGQSAGRCWEMVCKALIFITFHIYHGSAFYQGKNVVLILSLASRKPPIMSCGRLPGAWQALRGRTKAEAWAQKDLLPGTEATTRLIGTGSLLRHSGKLGSFLGHRAGPLSHLTSKDHTSQHDQPRRLIR